MGFLVIFWRISAAEVHSELQRNGWRYENRNCYRLSRVSWALAQIFCTVS